jgi:2-C-methyl-D-erythritol 4-phosphate cytidylyltransferase
MTTGVGAVIAAGGLGMRLRESGDLEPLRPKALRLLAGEPLLVHAVRALGPWVDEVSVAAPPDELEAVGELLRGTGITGQVVAGGKTRQASVHNALVALSADVELVLVHDAARPLVPGPVVERVLSALRAGAEAVVPALPVVDSLRKLSPDGSSRFVDRSTVVAVQTPQGFRRTTLESAHADWAGGDASDDATLVEGQGVSVVVVEGSADAFKVTRPVDLAVAEAILAGGAGLQT